MLPQLKGPSRESTQGLSITEELPELVTDSGHCSETGTSCWGCLCTGGQGRPSHCEGQSCP